MNMTEQPQLSSIFQTAVLVSPTSMCPAWMPLSFTYTGTI